jgi:lysozyme
MDIRQQLIRDEDCKLYAYPDKFGYITIGIGRLIDKRKGGGISQEEADYLFEHDIQKIKAAVAANIPFFKNLNDARQGVLLNMCFNMGINDLLGFPKMLAAMEREDWIDAGKHLLGSLYAKQLPARAGRLAQQLVTGEWQ